MTRAPTAAAGLPEPAAGPPAPLVLVVEDEARIAAILVDYLTSAGFRCHAVANGLDAPAAALDLGPDLILLDIMLPGQDGLAVCREVRRHSNVPIIMVTARAEEIDRLLGLELGADDYICKPFSPREVVARVKAVLRRVRSPAETPPPALNTPAAEANAAMSATAEADGDLDRALIAIDGGRQWAAVGGERLDLTPTELRLLVALHSAGGQVLSRAALSGQVYDGPGDGGERAIDSHIKNLRRKIARIAPDRDLIQSVYGVGYRLALPPRSGDLA